MERVWTAAAGGHRQVSRPPMSAWSDFYVNLRRPSLVKTDFGQNKEGTEIDSIDGHYFPAELKGISLTHATFVLCAEGICRSSSIAQNPLFAVTKSEERRRRNESLPLSEVVAGERDAENFGPKL